MLCSFALCNDNSSEHASVDVKSSGNVLSIHSISFLGTAGNWLHVSKEHEFVKEFQVFDQGKIYKKRLISTSSKGIYREAGNQGAGSSFGHYFHRKHIPLFFHASSKFFSVAA